MLNLKVGDIVKNILPDNKGEILCRVIELNVAGTNMPRLADVRDTNSVEWLIKNNKTWACPVENIQKVDLSDIHVTTLYNHYISGIWEGYTKQDHMNWCKLMVAQTSLDKRYSIGMISIEFLQLYDKIIAEESDDGDNDKY